MSISSLSIYIYLSTVIIFKNFNNIFKLYISIVINRVINLPGIIFKSSKSLTMC